jgi:Na+/melibiose symporter-like transporter
MASVTEVSKADPEREERLSTRFWLSFVGAILAIGLAGLIFFWLLGRAWYEWGFLGVVIILVGFMLAGAYMSDRREQRRRLGT